jgi:micrococcal nuclease
MRKINEKLVGLVLILMGLLGLWRGWWSLAENSDLKTDAAAPVTLLARNPSPAPSERIACKVITVYDGDTLGCDLNGDGQIQKPEEEVRLLGVDSPEMHYSRKNKTYGSDHPVDEPFAKEASQWLTQQVEGTVVYLEFDRKRVDKYDRTLAYVYAKPDAVESLNAGLLKKGYATLLVLGKNRRYESEFQVLETQARLSKKGLWR